jgi:tetratricopeptide (TPR) repeat protein/predicted Ser/Thr protein kinase
MGRAEVGSDRAERANDTLPSEHDDSLDETLPSGEHPPLHPAERAALKAAAIGTPVRFPVPAALPFTVASEPVAEVGQPIDSPLEVAPGSRLGRYVIQGQLGSGTMGLVLAAIDPALDRKVALKVVRPDQMGGSTAGRQRLVREAQAMARLAHPNVVTVYEVGTVSDHVFVAMEHIAGSTLDAWLKAAPRSLREIVDAFAAAGRGLAAAHAAGIVHRDFKPANVLIAGDGRVRVADFGLATSALAPVDPTGPRPSIAPLTETLSITQTGALLGTPAYMSPEQHLARAADARADQFSFSVAMYEALYRQLPFAGEGYLAYAHSVTEGRIREAPRGSRVPKRIHRILLRGLSTDPAHRYPSMRALLADLDHAMAAPRRRLAIGGAGALGIAALSFALIGSRGEDSDPCAAAEQPAASLWDAAARGKVEAGFRASGLPEAAAAFARVDRAMSAQVGRIRAMRRDACVATAVRHEQSAVLFDRRVECLDRRGQEVKAFSAVFASAADRSVLNKAVEAAVSLAPVDSCADRDALLAAVPLPDDPATRARVAALDARLERGKALQQAGKYPEALAEVTAVLAEAGDLPYTPLRARAHFASASVHNALGEYEKSEAEVRASVELAAAARDDKLVAEMWLLLYKTIGYDQLQADKAASFEPAVVAAVERAGGGHELRGQLDSTRGAIELRAEQYQKSVDHYLSARQHLEAAFGAESTKVADTLASYGTALEGVSRYDEARAALEQAMALRIKLLGPDHMHVGSSEKSLGILFDEMGRPAEALPHFQRAVAIYEKSLPPDHPTLANSLSSLGVVLDNVDRSREAVPYHLRAVALLEKRGKDAAIPLSYALSNLGVSYMEQERYDDAIRAYQRALALKEETVGPDHPAVAYTLCSMGVAYRRIGKLARAESLCRRSLAIFEKKVGRDNPECAGPLESLAETLLVAGRAGEALPLIARARALEEKQGDLETAGHGMTLVLHGRVLVAARRAPEGLALMARGLDLMKQHGGKKKDVAEAERQLAAARTGR